METNRRVGWGGNGTSTTNWWSQVRRRPHGSGSGNYIGIWNREQHPRTAGSQWQQTTIKLPVTATSEIDASVSVDVWLCHIGSPHICCAVCTEQGGTADYASRMNEERSRVTWRSDIDAFRSHDHMRFVRTKHTTCQLSLHILRSRQYQIKYRHRLIPM